MATAARAMASAPCSSSARGAKAERRAGQLRPCSLRAPPRGAAAFPSAAGPAAPTLLQAGGKRGSGVARAASETAEEMGVMPVVKIDNQSDAFATIITITFGDKLGDLLDTVAALKNLGLNIQRAKLESQEASVVNARNKFFVTDASKGEKVTSSEKLEEIRLTILNNMLEYHPEAGESLSIGGKSWSAASLRDATRSLGAKFHSAVETKIQLYDGPGNRFTVLKVQTADRPGLLVDMVHILKDVSVNVLSAEVDTVGKEADDTLLVSYHGEALNSSMQQLVKNALQYYLSLAEIAKDESY